MPISRQPHGKPTIWTPLALSVGGLLAWTISGRVKVWSEILFWQGVAVILVVGALCTGLYWMFYAFTILRQEWFKAGMPPPVEDKSDVKLALAKIIVSMTPEQTTAFGRARVETEIVPGHNTEPHQYLVLPEGRIAWIDVTKFMQRCTPTHLAAIRWWGSETRTRQAAQWLTAHFIADGLAYPDNGNESATWAGPRAMQEAIDSIKYVPEELEDQ